MAESLASGGVRVFGVRLAPQRLIVLLLVAAGVMACVLMMWEVACRREDERLRNRFENAVDHHVSALRGQLADHLNILRSFRTLFAYSDQVTREEFEGACQQVMLYDSTILALEWVPRVKREERASFESQARASGYADYAIKDLGPLRELVRAANRDVYYPIYFIHPIRGNERAFGLDIRNIPYRQELNLCLLNGKPAGSSTMSFVQNSERVDGWIISIPVFKAGLPAGTPEEREKALMGFMQAIFYLKDFFASAWGPLKNEGLEVTVEDLARQDGPSTLYTYRPEGMKAGSHPGPYVETVAFDAYQRPWRLTFRPTSAVFSNIATHQPQILLAGGTIITVLITAFFFGMMRQTAIVENTVSERTRDLELANRSLKGEIQQREDSERARAKLESQLRHSQKMEAVGTLAGGIAHDFNNILSAILGNLDLLRYEIPQGLATEELLGEIEKAGLRAKDLVRQILTFSRQEEQERHPVDLGPVVAEAIGLLRSTLPTSVELAKAIDPDLPKVTADPTQIHQVVVNLGTNAWHALDSKSGRVEIGLKAETLEKPLAALDAFLEPGDYLCLWVRDNGKGMDAATRERIFEPFFTTKEQGRGTGLGLSLVHGIVQAHDGAILVDSTPGLGTTFKIYFPVCGPGSGEIRSEQEAVPLGGGQRVWVVDDEETIVDVLVKQLSKCGYQAVGFSSGSRALTRIQQDPQGIDVLITDAAMPNLSGVEIADIAHRLRPDLPIILHTGHLSVSEQKDAERAGVRWFLSKPVPLKELMLCLHRALKNPKP